MTILQKRPVLSARLLLLLCCALLPIGGFGVFSASIAKLDFEEIYFLLFVSLTVILFCRNIDRNLLLLFLATSGYLLSQFLIEIKHISGGELLKLSKPYLLFLFFSLSVSFNTNLHKYCSQNRVIALIVLLVFVDLLCWIVAQYNANLLPQGIRKEFYLRTGVLRYYDVYILFVEFLILYLLTFTHHQKKKFVLISLFLIVFFLTLDRVFLVFGLFLLINNSKNRILYFALLLLLSPVFYLAVSTFDFSSEVARRFYALFDLLAMYDELLNRFILPVTNAGYEFTASNIIFGEGVLQKFFIPWYEYRGLNPYHYSVDSFVITIFVKHGLVGIFLLGYIIIKCFRCVKHSKILQLWLIFYLILHNGAFVISFLILSFLVRNIYDENS